MASEITHSLFNKTLLPSIRFVFEEDGGQAACDELIAAARQIGFAIGLSGYETRHTAMLTVLNDIAESCDLMNRPYGESSLFLKFFDDLLDKVEKHHGLLLVIGSANSIFLNDPKALMRLIEWFSRHETRWSEKGKTATLVLNMVSRNGYDNNGGARSVGGMSANLINGLSDARPDEE